MRRSGTCWHAFTLHSLPLLAEVLDGVKAYFDFMLADHLLYPSERTQHEAWFTPTSAERYCAFPPSAGGRSQGATGALPCHQPSMASCIYGGEHLLRLFVRLPWFLSHTSLPANHLITLNCHLKDILRYVLALPKAILVGDPTSPLQLSVQPKTAAVL